MVPLLDRLEPRLARLDRPSGRTPKRIRPPEGKTRFLLEGNDRHHVQISLWCSGTLGNRCSRRLRPDPASEGKRRFHALLRRSREKTIRPARDRAFSRSRPDSPRRLVFRLSRRRSRWRKTDRPQTPSADRSGESGHLPARKKQTGTGRNGRKPLSQTEAASQCFLGHLRRDRPSLPPHGRNRHAVGHHSRFRFAREQYLHRSRPRYDGTSADDGRRNSRTPRRTGDLLRKSLREKLAETFNLSFFKSCFSAFSLFPSFFSQRLSWRNRLKLCHGPIGTLWKHALTPNKNRNASRSITAASGSKRIRTLRNISQMFKNGA